MCILVHKKVVVHKVVCIYLQMHMNVSYTYLDMHLFANENACKSQPKGLQMHKMTGFEPIIAKNVQKINFKFTMISIFTTLVPI